MVSKSKIFGFRSLNFSRGILKGGVVIPLIFPRNP